MGRRRGAIGGSAQKIEGGRSRTERTQSQAQRTIEGESQEDPARPADHASSDAEIAAPEGHQAIANGQTPTTVAIENEEIASQDLEGEIGGIGREAPGGHVVDVEIVLGFADGALHVGSLVVEASDVFGSPVEIGHEETVEVAGRIEETTLRVVHLALGIVLDV